MIEPTSLRLSAPEQSECPRRGQNFGHNLCYGEVWGDFVESLIIHIGVRFLMSDLTCPSANSSLALSFGLPFSIYERKHRALA